MTKPAEDTATASANEQPKKASLSDVLNVLGPIVAGFQLASAVIGYVGVGALASWVVSVWFPFTRGLWELLLRFIKLPFQLTDLEKDSMTTLVFFLPVAISGLLRRDDMYAISGKVARVGALITGIIFTIIVGRQVWVDLAGVFWITFNSPRLLLAVGIPTLVAVVLIIMHSEKSETVKRSAAITGLQAVGIDPKSNRPTHAEFQQSLHWLELDPTELSVENMNELQKVTNFLRLEKPFENVDLARKRVTTLVQARSNRLSPFEVGAISLLMAGLLWVMLLPLVMMYVAYSEVGPVRSFATIGFIAALAICILKSPRRLFYTLGTFLAFLSAGVVWQALAVLSTWMEGLAKGIAQ